MINDTLFFLIFQVPALIWTSNRIWGQSFTYDFISMLSDILYTMQNSLPSQESHFKITSEACFSESWVKEI